MRQEFETYLCVGGPLSGQRKEAHPSGFRVPVMEERSTDVAPWLIDASKPVQCRDVRYVRDDFRTETRTVFFWRPDDQPHDRTLRLLLETMMGERSGLTDEERAVLARVAASAG